MPHTRKITPVIFQNRSHENASSPRHLKVLAELLWILPLDHCYWILGVAISVTISVSLTRTKSAAAPASLPHQLWNPGPAWVPLIGRARSKPCILAVMKAEDVSIQHFHLTWLIHEMENSPNIRRRLICWAVKYLL